MVQNQQDMTTEAFPLLEGVIIKNIYRNLASVAELHSVLTSPRGKYLHRRLLHAMREKLSYDEIERLCKEYDVEESDRHINRLTKWQLIEPATTPEGVAGYVRTELGEEALNTVREMERKIGEEKAEVICRSALGVNAMKMFLTIFGNNKEADLFTREVTYTPLEIGQLIRGFVRNVEGISSLDKLDDAGIVSYLDDGNIHVNPRRSTAFYGYLKKLYELLERSRRLEDPLDPEMKGPRPWTGLPA